MRHGPCGLKHNGKRTKVSVVGRPKAAALFSAGCGEGEDREGPAPLSKPHLTSPKRRMSTRDAPVLSLSGGDDEATFRTGCAFQGDLVRGTRKTRLRTTRSRDFELGFRPDRLERSRAAHSHQGQVQRHGYFAAKAIGRQGLH